MTSHTYFGIYRGICVDNADPLSKNRIKLKVPQVLHTNVTNWAFPCLPVTDNSTHATHTDSITSGAASAGTSHTHAVVLNAAHSSHVSVPSLNQGVWVMFEGGDINFPVWIGVY